MNEAPGFFDVTEWAFDGKIGETTLTDPKFGTGSGASGTYDLSTLFDLKTERVMLVFKGGSNPLVGYLLSDLTGTWQTPFISPPFNLPGKATSQDVSHVSVYSSNFAAVPLPATGVMLLAAAGGLGAIRLRRKTR